MIQFAQIIQLSQMVQCAPRIKLASVIQLRRAAAGWRRSRASASLIPASSKPLFVSLTSAGTWAMSMGLLLGMLITCWGCGKQYPTKEELLKDTSPAARAVIDPPSGDPMVSTPMVVSGVERPPMAPAAEADLPADAAVIGVVVDGQARAYPLQRLSGMMEHVVNDLVAGRMGQMRPISITYCDRTDCVQVFTPEDALSQASLEMGTVGLIEGALGLTYQAQQFRQTDPIPGLQTIDPVRTTWLEWRLEHPDTLVYAGVVRKDTMSN